MLIVRSVLFNILYYINLAVWLVLALPALALPRRVMLAMIRLWARCNFFLLRFVAGIEWEVRGRENLLPGAVLVAAKHQSVWDTFALFLVFDDVCYVLKRELIWIPLFGWMAAKQRMVAVNRGARSRAMKKMYADSKVELAKGRQIAIFPEGTRRAPGASPDYKYGIVYLYSELGVPCVPVALNSGLFWPRRKFIKRPGKIILEILPPIMPGLDKANFFNLLQERIESASGRLVADAVAADSTLLPPPAGDSRSA